MPRKKLLSKGEFAEALGLTAGRISQLIRLGLPVERSGGIDLDKAENWYRGNIERRVRMQQNKARVATGTKVPRRRKPGVDRGTEPDGYFEARARREYVRLQKETLEVARLRESLLDADEVKKAWEGLVEAVRARFQLVVERAPESARSIVTREVNECLRLLSAWRPPTPQL